MNKATILGAIVVIAIGLYIGFGRSTGPKMMPAASNEHAATTANTPPTSLKALMAAKTPQKCEFSDKSNEGTSGATLTEGTVYVADGKVRGDFRSTPTGPQAVGPVSGHMIITASETYIWTDGSTSGMKVKMDAAAQENANRNDRGLDPNKNMNYSCSGWSVDANLFVAPTNVTFSDLGGMMGNPAMNGSIKGSAQGSATMDLGVQCAQCDALPPTSKAQCRTALHCS